MIVEFRMPLPMTVDDYQVAQLFMVVKASLENTDGGEGVVVEENRPYDNSDGHWGVSEINGVTVPRNKGQYTLKKYYVASKVSATIRALAPAEALVLTEQAWNAYPDCLTGDSLCLSTCLLVCPSILLANF